MASTLPPELLTCILDKLMEPVSDEEYETTAAHRARCTEDLYSLLLVCKAWSASAIPHLYKDLILPVHDPLQSELVLRSLLHHGDLVRRLTVEDVPEWLRRPPAFSMSIGFMASFALTSHSGDDGDSPLVSTFRALAVCSRLRALTLTLRVYPEKSDFDQLCRNIQGLSELEELELRCAEQSNRWRDDSLPLLTSSTIHQLVLPVPGLKSFTCKPITQDTYTFPPPSTMPHPSQSPTHTLQNLSVQGDIYTVSLVSLLRPFQALHSLTLMFSRQSCVTQEDLASLLFRLRGTLQKLTLTAMMDNLRRRADGVEPFFSELESESEPGRSSTGSAAGALHSARPQLPLSAFPIQDILPTLLELHSLVLNLHTPSASRRARQRIFDSDLFAYLPGGLRVLRADIGDVSPSKVVAFLERAKLASEGKERVQLKLLVVQEAWKEDKEGEKAVRRMLEQQGGRYVYAEGWSQGDASVDIYL